MSPDRSSPTTLPDPVRRSLDDFRDRFDLDVHLWLDREDGGPVHLYPDGSGAREGPAEGSAVRRVTLRDGRRLSLEARDADAGAEGALGFLATTLRQTYQFDREVRFFTRELSERYEEINLLYSISEILASVLSLEAAAEAILREVCDVLEARRGSLWVHDGDDDELRLVASVGEAGLTGPMDVDDTDAVTARIFRESEPRIISRVRSGNEDSVLSVPIRYRPPDREMVTIGVVNLIGHRNGDAFSAAEQKLLSAIASQIGAAIETNRLIQESLAQERVSREMELAHDLQMKLLPRVAAFEGVEAAARCEPAESVGGDFYHLFRLSGGRIGMLIGDVSSHGFPAALIMALATSAAGIYVQEVGAPAEALDRIHAALRDELETTEMYLTLFYGVIDPGDGSLTYSNAGHPHAFRVPGEGGAERLEATDPPLGITDDVSYGERRVPWEPARDLLLLFTDGLSDTLACESRGDGEACVVREAEGMRDASPEAIVEHLFELASRAEPRIRGDDRTALVVRA